MRELQYWRQRAAHRVGGLRLAAATEQTQALQMLSPVISTYLPWSAMSLRPSAMVTILNDIVIWQRQTVVEFGSGLSTIIIATLLRQRGGHLWSVEHDEGWAKFMSDYLASEGLSEQVTLVVAPLTSGRAGQPSPPWYDEAPLMDLPDKVDLMLVDGPISHGRSMRVIRGPALPYMADRLADGATVILDDVDRRGERDVLKAWQKAYSLDFRCRTADNLGVGTWTTPDEKPAP